MARWFGRHGSSSRRSSPASDRSPRNTVFAWSISNARLSSALISAFTEGKTPRDSSSKNRCTSSSKFGCSVILLHWRESGGPNDPTTHLPEGVKCARGEREYRRSALAAYTSCAIGLSIPMISETCVARMVAMSTSARCGQQSWRSTMWYCDLQPWHCE